jgi:hypothetical protein
MLSVLSQHESSKVERIREKYGDRFPKERYVELNSEKLFDEKTPIIMIGEREQLLFQTQWAFINSQLDYTLRLKFVDELERVLDHCKSWCITWALEHIPNGYICPHLLAYNGEVIKHFIGKHINGNDELNLPFKRLFNHHLGKCLVTKTIKRGVYLDSGVENHLRYEDDIWKKIKVEEIRSKYRNSICIDRYKELNEINAIDRNLPIYHMWEDQLWYQSAWIANRRKSDYPFRIMVKLNKFSIKHHCMNFVKSLQINRFNGYVGAKCTHLSRIFKEFLIQHEYRLSCHIDKDDFTFGYYEICYQHFKVACK